MPVAVKVLKREGLTAAIRRQFVDEANTMAQLADHPYIVQVFRSEQTADGGGLPRHEVLPAAQPRGALAGRADERRGGAAHRHPAGERRRDRAPGRHHPPRHQAGERARSASTASPALTDFGIAGRGGHAEDVDEDVGVSVPWSPPEVLYGLSNGDARSDVYSLAATLWHLLVGRSPFEQPGGDNSAYALMPRIRAVPVPPTGRADVPVSLERLLAHAMAKDPGSRPQTALELARGLQAVEQEQRLPRTPVVVLDEQGRSALAEGVRGRAPEELDRDRTSVRTPTSLVTADAVRTPAPAEARRRRRRSADDQWRADPRAWWGCSSSAWSARWSGRSAATAPRSPADGGGPLADRQPPRRAVDYPEQPAIDARPVPGAVTFTWNYVGSRRATSSSCGWPTARRPSSTRVSPRVQGRPRHTVKATTGELVCAQVDGVAQVGGALAALGDPLPDRRLTGIHRNREDRHMGATVEFCGEEFVGGR